MDHSPQTEQEQEAVHHCHWHPTVETGLFCSRCDKFVCTQCMVQAPVGIRCRECGKAVRMPTYDVRPTYYARAAGVAVAVAIVGGLLWALFTAMFGAIPFFPSLAAIGVGYGAGELISKAVNRKRGKGLAWITGCSVASAFLISWLISPFSFSIFGLLFLGFGVYAAVQRVR
jgi:hypothetical protein